MAWVKTPGDDLASGIIPLILLGVAVFVIFHVVANQGRKKRRSAMEAVANRLGLEFFPENDYSLDEQLPFLNKLCQGNKRYGFNLMCGCYRGHEVKAFDYHYQTRSTGSDGKRKTEHHYINFFMLQYPANFPELTICREGWFSKLTQFFGFEDIDFESAEFSRTFLVKSVDKKFAYDICHGKMMEFLLDNKDLNIEMERDCLTFCFPQLPVTRISAELDRLVAMRKLFPKYLIESA